MNRQPKSGSIAVLIPTYNRPEMLKMALQSWLEVDSVDKIFVVAEASSQVILKEYEKVIKDYAKCKCGRVVYQFALKKLGSVKARNALLDMVSTHNCGYVVMADDDYLLPDKSCLVKMVKALESDNRLGAVGGKVIVKRLRQDGDFFLNLPMNAADLMSKLTGYVFLDVKHGPRYSEFLPPFFMMKKEVLDKNVRYDKLFDTPTGFREESDFQLQIKRLGYSLLYDPRLYVIHLAAEEGGNRPKMSMGKRIYWKTRNNAVFIFKWNKFLPRKLWCIFFSALILSLYRAWDVPWVFRGITDGICDSENVQFGSEA